MDNQIKPSKSFNLLCSEYTGLSVGLGIGFVSGIIVHALLGINGLLISIGLYFLYKYLKNKETTKEIKIE